jgi:hypothetical protein
VHDAHLGKGFFRFTVPRTEFQDRYTVVAAAAANYGLGWVEIPAENKREDLTVKLVADDVPITGQIVDLEAKPVAGATITVKEIKAAPGEDIGPWVEAAKAKKGLRYPPENQFLPRYTHAVPVQVVTDSEGRFRLTGIGRNRLVDESGTARAGVDLELNFRPRKHRFFGAYYPERTRTDQEGRFRIAALLPGCEFQLSDGKGQVSLGAAPGLGQTKDAGDVRMKREGE